MRKLTLSSALLLVGAAGASAARAAPPESVVFRDPAESAFTVNVPKGWAAVGATRRAGTIDPRVSIKVTSPDGTVNAFFGDADIGMYQVPDRARLALGMREGQVIDTGPARMMLMRYAGGPQFAENYIRSRLCRKPQIVSSSESAEDSRDLAARVIEANRGAMSGVRVVAHVGRVGFLCGEQAGAVLAGTALASPAGGGIQVWSVPVLAGFVTRQSAQTELGKYVMDTMVASFRFDPAWQARFNQQAQRITGQAIADQNRMLEGVRQRASQQAQASSLNHPNDFKPRSGAATPRDTVTGNAQVCDSLGRCGSVAHDHDAYYMDHSGNIRGTSGPPPDNSGVWSPMAVQGRN